MTVAAALSVVLLAATAVLFNRGLAAWRRSEGELDQLLLAERGLELLGAELRSGVAAADRPFEGTPALLHFATAAGAIRLMEVQYRLQPKGKTQALVREFQSYPSKEGSFQTQTLLSSVHSFSIQYGLLQEEGEGGPRHLAWSDRWTVWPQKNQLPKLLRVRLEIKDPQGTGRLIQREFRIPHGVFGSAEEKAG